MATYDKGNWKLIKDDKSHWHYERLSESDLSFNTTSSSHQPMCSGICLTGYDVGVPSDAIAYAHPQCELHGEPEELHHENCPCHDCMYDKLSEGW